MTTILCSKYGKELPALKKAPVKGELGELALKKVSANGWRLWLICQTIIINDNQLNLMDDGSIHFLMDSLTEFLKSDSVEQELLAKLVKQDIELPQSLLDIALEQGLIESPKDDESANKGDMFYEA